MPLPTHLPYHLPSGFGTALAWLLWWWWWQQLQPELQGMDGDSTTVIAVTGLGWGWSKSVLQVCGLCFKLEQNWNPTKFAG